MQALARAVTFSLTLVACTGGERNDSLVPGLGPRPDDPTFVQAVLGPEGGTLTAAAGASLSVPKGALDGPAELAVALRNPDELAPLPAGLARSSWPFAFLPHGQRFEKSVRVQLRYAGGDEGLTLLRLDDERDTSWEPIAHDEPLAGVMGAALTRFSVLVVARASDEGRMDAAIAPPHDASLPAPMDAAMHGGDAHAPSPMDAAMHAHDANGTSPTDASRPTDAAPPPNDAKVLPASDAGLPHVDASVATPRDASAATVDAAAASDGGARDAGARDAAP